MSAPLRRVVTGGPRVATSIGAGFKFYYWSLTLECGHTVERRVRYMPRTDGRRVQRGYAAQHHPPTVDRIPACPKRARCEECIR